MFYFSINIHTFNLFMGSTLNLCYNEIACLSMKGPSTRGFNVYFIFYLALQIRSFTLRDWINFNFNQTFTSRQTKFNTIPNNNFKVGNNLLSTRLTIVTNQIDLLDLNLTLNSFKIKYKKLMLCT